MLKRSRPISPSTIEGANSLLLDPVHPWQGADEFREESGSFCPVLRQRRQKAQARPHYSPILSSQNHFIDFKVSSELAEKSEPDPCSYTLVCDTLG